MIGLLGQGATLTPQQARAADTFSDLGVLGSGSNSLATALSATGAVVVGRATDGVSKAFRWTANEGMVALNGLNGGTISEAWGVSGDGQIVVGSAIDPTAGNATLAFRWAADTQAMTSLGTLVVGGTSVAYGISHDGHVIVGSATDASGADRAFRWEGNTMTHLGVLNGGNLSVAWATSQDGSVIAGYANDGDHSNQQRAFRWSAATGMQSLSTLPGGTSSAAYGISSDGSVVVGVSTDANNADRAFRWTLSSNAMTSLGVLNSGDASFARGVSGDGLIVVGYATDGAAGNAPRAFRWSSATGMQSVEQWLTAAGVNVAPGLKTRLATATNADGSVVVGRLENDHAFIARVGRPVTETGTEAPSPGAGLIDTSHFLDTLLAAARPHRLANAKADMVMHGLHGTPLREFLRPGQHSVWTSGDFGRQDHRENNGNVDAGEAGYAYGLTSGLMARAAVGRTYSDNQQIFDGNTTLHGTYLLPEIIYAIPDSPLRASASFYYNTGEAKLRRGYLNAGTQDYSRATAKTQSQALRLRLDWINAASIAGAVFSPYASLTRSHSRIDAHSESGGGFPVRWNARAEADTQARIGTDASYDLGNGMNLVGRLEAVHRLETTGSPAAGEILGLGSFSFAGEPTKRDWLRAGFGAEGKAGPGILSMMVNTTTEARAASTWFNASYRINF